MAYRGEGPGMGLGMMLCIIFLALPCTVGLIWALDRFGLL